MQILTGKNLGSRQKELNIKVIETASNKTNFEDVKAQTEKNDVDKLFKIDLASKYKNVEYIIEVLKSGDSLYISRALKCIWLYVDEYVNIINPENIHHNIFPFMSTKMQRKLLSTISMHMKNERAVAFFKYCMSNNLKSVALKFLIFTSDSHKLEILNNPKTRYMIQNKEKVYIQHFVGKSFVLADTLINSLTDNKINHVLHKLRYLYCVSDVNYLEMVEKYSRIEQIDDFIKFGLRITKDIMINHKNRLHEHPELYLKLLNQNALVKRSTSEDAKKYITVLLPRECSTFWDTNFYETNKHLFDLIPFEKRLQFLKKIFNYSFPGEEFETSLNFYKFEYYTLMTTKERESWALNHIQSGLELLGSGKDFIWYKFITFDRAFHEIKKLIMITKKANEREELMNVLVDCAINDKEIETLLNYYYDRHVNESQYHKDRFVTTILNKHNVFSFSDSCFEALDKLFYNLEVYNDVSFYYSEYRSVALIYAIIHRNYVPDVFETFLDSGVYYYTFMKHFNKLSNQEKEVVYQYMLKFYLDKLNVLCNNDDKNVDDDVNAKIKKYNHHVLDVMCSFNKPKEDIPEIVNKYIKLDWDEYKLSLMLRLDQPGLTQEVLIRLLKEDASLVVSKLPLIKVKLDNLFAGDTFRFNKLLRKLKIYFSHDLAKDYMECFEHILSKPELYKIHAETAICCLFHLADDNYKIELMSKYYPADPKIDRSAIDLNLSFIQEAICRLAYYSRPPVPLSSMMLYVKGDYVKYCLPTFYSYLAKLPLPLCIDFTKSLLDAPLSIQKHGLRFAFQCFNLDDLKKLILDIWKKSHNVSLRAVIYKALFTKITEDTDSIHELFEILKTLTLDLHENDYQHVFNLVTSNSLPAAYIADYLDTVWKMINKPTHKLTHVKRKINVLNCINSKIDVIPNYFLESIIYEHLKSALQEEHISVMDSNSELIKAKWLFTAKYLVHFTSKDDLKNKIELTQFIINKYVIMWNKVHEEEYIIKKLCYQFINDLENECYKNSVDSMMQGNIIFELILKEFQNALPLHEIYVTILELRLSIICREIVIVGKRRVSLEGVSATLMILEECITKFGKQFANLLNDIIKKQMYHSYIFEDIKLTLEKYTQQLLQHINSCELYSFSKDEANILICSELLEFKMLNAYIFAIKILPSEYSDSNRYFEKYKYIITTIKMFDNKELECNIYKKFGDFKHKEFI